MLKQVNLSSVIAKLLIITLIPTLLMGSMMLWQMHLGQQAGVDASHVVALRFKKLGSIRKLSRAVTFNVIDTSHKARANMLLWPEAKTLLVAGRKDMQQLWQSLHDSKDTLTQSKITDAQEQIFNDAVAAVDVILGYVAEKSSYEMGNYIDLDMYSKLDPLLKFLDELGSQQNIWATEEIEHSNNQIDKLQSAFYLGLGICLFLVAALGLAITHSIRSPLNHLQNIMQRVANERDLGLRMSLTKNDEFKIIGESFNAMINNIQTVVKECITSLDAVDSSAIELISSSQQNQSRTQQIHCQLINVAAAAEEMARSTQAVKSHCEETALTTKNADSHAIENFNFVKKTTGQVKSLSRALDNSVCQVNQLCEQGKAIGAMLEVIKSVAEQTNLLALNAAIEAARAGEQGRGFAVVADEVRSLAQRTQHSTAEIEQIIIKIQLGTEKTAETIQENATFAQNSAEAIAQSEETLNLITQSFGRILSENNAIVTSVKEQAEASSDVSRAIHEIQNLADQGNASAHEALNHANTLKACAGRLQQVLAKFQV